ncbi:MAG: glycine cleavage system protein GcvH [Roseiflexaceae bacterium]|nr:glycine cleavage system protein GcvH [Roseiflexaceae bacterium]
MSFNTPGELKYTKTHEWVRFDGDQAIIGITDYAQDALGDVVYIDLPAEGATLEAETIFGAVESVKAASDLYLPVSGTIMAVNSTLMDTPELINSDPYGAGWMLKIKVSADGPLINAAAYEAFVDSIKH